MSFNPDKKPIALSNYLTWVTPRAFGGGICLMVFSFVSESWAIFGIGLACTLASGIAIMRGAMNENDDTSRTTPILWMLAIAAVVGLVLYFSINQRSTNPFDM